MFYYLIITPGGRVFFCRGGIWREENLVGEGEGENKLEYYLLFHDLIIFIRVEWA